MDALAYYSNTFYFQVIEFYIYLKKENEGIYIFKILKLKRLTPDRHNEFSDSEPWLSCIYLHFVIFISFFFNSTNISRGLL